MNKVWIVEYDYTIDDYPKVEEHGIEAVFDSEEKAVKYVYDKFMSDFDDRDAYEYTFDEIPTLEYIRENHGTMEYSLDDMEMEHKAYFYYEKEVQ